MKKENGEVYTDHPLVEFLSKPNKNQQFEEFVQDYVRNLKASGYAYLLPTSKSDAYLRRIDNLDSESRPEIKVLNTDKIDYIGKSFFGLVDRRDEFRYRQGDSEVIYNYNDILPFWDKVQDPGNFRLGVSRLTALKDEITNIILANRGKTNKIKNSGKFILTPSSRSLQQGFGNQLDMPVSQENPNYKQKDFLEDKLAGTGLAQERSITVTKVEMDAKNITETIQSYSYDNEVTEDKRAIKNAYGIPRELQNIGDDNSKYENRKAAYLELFTLNTISISNNLCQTIQRFYAPKEKDRLFIDYSSHPAFEITKGQEQERVSNEIETLTGLYEKGVIEKKTLIKKLQDAKLI